MESPSTVGAALIQPSQDLFDFLRDKNEEERKELLSVIVQKEISLLLEAPEESRYDASRPLKELGVGSLLCILLRDNLDKKLDGKCDLPKLLAFDYPTVDQLAGFISAQIAACPSPSGAADAQAA